MGLPLMVIENPEPTPLLNLISFSITAPHCRS
jgi:hypothetical protein